MLPLPENPDARLYALEQELMKLDVDIKRLWRRFPSVPRDGGQGSAPEAPPFECTYNKEPSLAFCLIPPRISVLRNDPLLSSWYNLTPNYNESEFEIDIVSFNASGSWDSYIGIHSVTWDDVSGVTAARYSDGSDVTLSLNPTSASISLGVLIFSKTDCGTTWTRSSSSDPISMVATVTRV